AEELKRVSNWCGIDHDLMELATLQEVRDREKRAYFCKSRQSGLEKRIDFRFREKRSLLHEVGNGVAIFVEELPKSRSGIYLPDRKLSSAYTMQHLHSRFELHIEYIGERMCRISRD